MTPIDKDSFYLKLDDLMEIDSGTVKGSAQLADLEAWNSLAIMSFIALADSEYGVSLPAKSINACRTVDDLAALIEAGKNG